MNIKKRHLRKASTEDLRRLARWLKVKDMDDMSDRQLMKFLVWLFSRPEKKRLGLTYHDW